MPALGEVIPLNGKWQGTNKLWLSPGEPVRESESLAEISTIAQGQFSEMRYTWAEGGKAQEGRIIIGHAPAGQAVNAVWFDTWHMMDQFMVCAGSVEAEGLVRVKGAYAAPPGPDWGWQIAVEPKWKDQFHLMMYNITPEGESFLAVETVYTRQS